MASSENWMNRRKGRAKGNAHYRLNPYKSPEENTIDILQGLYLNNAVQNDVSPTSKNPQDARSMSMSKMANQSAVDSRRVSYLTALVNLVCGTYREQLGFTPEELMICIRISLVEEAVAVRAAALRVLRYLIKTEEDVAVFNHLKLSYLVTRSLDLMLRNEEERTQALRVIRRVIAVVGPSGLTPAASRRRSRGVYIEPGMIRCLLAIARTGNGSDSSGDRLARPAIATIAEIGVCESGESALAALGAGAVVQALATCVVPRLSQALCAGALGAGAAAGGAGAGAARWQLLHAPYADLPRAPLAPAPAADVALHRESREVRAAGSRLALAGAARGWRGALWLRAETPRRAAALSALVRALRLPRLDTRKAILDLLYELLGLPQPEWTDEISVALAAIDPADFQDSWRLNEGFVAAEGAAILPHLAATGPDIAEMHLALLLQCLLDCGVVEALCFVCCGGDSLVGVRGVVLLGHVLALAARLLPAAARVSPAATPTPALPALLALAAQHEPRALHALHALTTHRDQAAHRPAARSLYLDHILRYTSAAADSAAGEGTGWEGARPLARHSVGSRADLSARNVAALVKSKSVSARTSAAVTKVARARIFSLFEKETDSLIRCSLVMQNKDGNTWNWEIIRTILKEEVWGRGAGAGAGGAWRLWAWSVVRYLRPSSNKYSHHELVEGAGGVPPPPARAALALVALLRDSRENEAVKMLEDLFSDVSRHVAAIESGRSAHECLFSPAHMGNTLCQTYFLLAAQLCHTQHGLDIFYRTKLYENLLELATKTHHTCYVKLIISSLDYTLDSYPRDILAKTLTCNMQVSRLYTTQFLNVLLRALQKSKGIMRKKMKRPRSVQDQIKKNGKEVESSNSMESWVLELLVGQIKDESKAIVKCALAILEEACHVPSYLEKLITLRSQVRDYCHFDMNADPASLNIAGSACGDRGYLLWLHLEISALSGSPDAESLDFVKRHLDFWTSSYNNRWVGVVEGAAQAALGGGGGEAEGGRGRGAGRAPLPAPPHLFPALAAAAPAAAALLPPHLLHHYAILKAGACSSHQEAVELKGAAWALGVTAGSHPGLQAVMQLSNGNVQHSVAALLARQAAGGVGAGAGVGVRAAAFYALGHVAATRAGADLLRGLGWLSVRHTRNDQFPIILEDNQTSTDTTHNYLITSPHRRRYVQRSYDFEVSEQSDHSTVESLYSDSKASDKRSITVTIEHHKDDSFDSIDVLMKLPVDKRKSHTLPMQGITHRPSISESRTVDILKDYSIYRGEIRNIGRINSLDTYEGRVRNTSESSTSGVSSCDSVLGRYNFPERVATLSPIPSSSSLAAAAGGRAVPRARPRPRRRGTAADTSAALSDHSHSFSGADSANSPPSQKDMAGYATLKSLNKHRRPHVSESSASGAGGEGGADGAGGGAAQELCWMLGAAAARARLPLARPHPRPHTHPHPHRSSLLEQDWRALGGGAAGTAGEAGARGRPPPSPERAAPAPLARAPPPHHRYIGLALPANLLDLYPSFEDETDDTAASSLSPSLTLADKLRASSDYTLPYNKEGSVTAETGYRPRRHSPDNCLVCPPRSNLQLREEFFASMDQATGAMAGSAPPAPLHELAAAQCALHHAYYMANPIHYRQSRPALAALKQQAGAGAGAGGAALRSACVYADVCALLASHTYTTYARRFLQELFLDVNFESFHHSAKEIIMRKLQAQATTSPTLSGSVHN